MAERTPVVLHPADKHSPLAGNDRIAGAAVAAATQNTFGVVTLGQLLSQESGTWTPELVSGGATFTNEVSFGTYLRTGKLVFYKAYLQLSNKNQTAPNAPVFLKNLPFDAETVCPQQVGMFSGWTVGSSATPPSAVSFSFRAGAALARGGELRVGDSTGDTQTLVLTANVSPTALLEVSGVYQTNGAVSPIVDPDPVSPIGDPYASMVVMSMQFEDTSPTVFTDSAAPSRVWTRTASAADSMVNSSVGGAIWDGNYGQFATGRSQLAYISAPHDPSLDLTSASEYTIEGTFNFSDIQGGGNVIIDKDGISGQLVPAYGVNIATGNGNTYLQFVLGQSNGTNAQVFQYPLRQISINTTYHFSINKFANDTLRIYLDGMGEQFTVNPNIAPVDSGRGITLGNVNGRSSAAANAIMKADNIKITKGKARYAVDYTPSPTTYESVAADTTPTEQNFQTQDNVQPNSLVTSNTITPIGYNAAAPISIISDGSEAAYRIDGGPFTSSSGTISPGQAVAVQHVTSPGNSTITGSVLRIGGSGFYFETKNIDQSNGA